MRLKIPCLEPLLMAFTNPLKLWGNRAQGLDFFKICKGLGERVGERGQGSATPGPLSQKTIYNNLKYIIITLRPWEAIGMRLSS